MRRLTTIVLALALLGTTPALAADYNHNRDRDRHSSYRDNDRHHGKYRNHRWNRGDRIERSWFLYTPVNWRSHNFRSPPSGYHWIYVDGFYLLINRNGIIVEVVAG